MIISHLIYVHDNGPNSDAKMDFSKMVLFTEAKLADTSDTSHDTKDPLQPQINDFRFENEIMFNSFIVNFIRWQRITRRLNFGFTPSPYLYEDSLRSSFVRPNYYSKFRLHERTFEPRILMILTLEICANLQNVSY
jgi:hypothetical protein